MSIYDAVRADCRMWKGTQESLSRDVCGSAQGLRHKLAGYKGSILSVEDAQSVMLLTGGRHTITEMARELGGMYLQLVSEEVDNADLISECYKIQQRMADLFDALSKSVGNDGVIDELEQHQIDDKACELREQVMQYLVLNYRVFGNDKVRKT